MSTKPGALQIAAERRYLSLDALALTRRLIEPAAPEVVNVAAQPSTEDDPDEKVVHHLTGRGPLTRPRTTAACYGHSPHKSHHLTRWRTRAGR